VTNVLYADDGMILLGRSVHLLEHLLGQRLWHLEDMDLASSSLSALSDVLCHLGDMAIHGVVDHIDHRLVALGVRHGGGWNGGGWCCSNSVSSTSWRRANAARF